MQRQVAFDFQQRIDRRCLLRGAGVAMAMPWLSAMQPAFGAGASSAPRRFVAMTLGLGLIADNLNPQETGVDYRSSPYLADCDDLRDAFTVVSGSSHPDVRGGHRAEASLLSAGPMVSEVPTGNSISIDQLLAKHLGHESRFPS
jgi:Protein of unknown function (DUF1552).